MYGPEPRGHWTAIVAPQDFQSLDVGKRYTVFRAFTDHDGDLHPVGETWRFLGHAFQPYDDGLSFFVSLDGGQEWRLPLQWRPEAQGPIIDFLDEYVQQTP